MNGVSGLEVGLNVLIRLEGCSSWDGLVFVLRCRPL